MNKATEVPFSVEAKTRDKLTKKMADINNEWGAYHNFFDIQFVQGNWVAWYVLDTIEVFKRQKINGGK